MPPNTTPKLFYNAEETKKPETTEAQGNALCEFYFAISGSIIPSTSLRLYQVKTNHLSLEWASDGL